MHILVECYVDNLLITLLGYSCHYDHSGIGNVANRMETNFRNDVVLGIVDDDINKPNYFDQFETIRRTPAINFLRHRNRHDRFLIIISRDIEDFIHSTAIDAGINTFTLHQLKKKSKKSTVKKDTAVSNYINRLIAANPDSLVFLRNCITENINL